MKLSEYISLGRCLHKNARLKIDITLDNGESMKKGDVGSLVLDFGDGTYHFEWNDFACKVTKNEIEILENK